MEIVHTPAEPLAGTSGVVIAEILQDLNPGAVRVHVAHVEAGATLPTRRAGLDEKYYVVAGEGEAVGDEGIAERIGPGDVVHWHEGELHTFWADTDITLVMVQTELPDESWVPGSHRPGAASAPPTGAAATGRGMPR